MRRFDVRRAIARAILAAVLLTASGFAIHRLCVIPYRDNRTKRVIEERMAIIETIDTFRAATLARLNLADLDRIARSHRLDPAWYLYYGANCEILERWNDAAQAYTNALEIDQRPEIYFSRGLVKLHLGDLDAAAEDMITAVRFNPFFIDRISGALRDRVAAGAGIP